MGFIPIYSYHKKVMFDGKEKFINEGEKRRSAETHERFGMTVSEVLGETDEMGYMAEVKDIEYVTREDKKFSFRSLIPNSWRLIRKSRDVMEADTEQKEIIYGDCSLQIQTSIIPEGQQLPEEINTDELMRRIDIDARRVIEVASPPQISRQGFFLSLLHEIGHAHVFETIRVQEHEDYHQARKLIYKNRNTFTPQEEQLYQKYVIQNEQDAWKWALDQFRKLRGEGIDLAPELADEEQVLKAIEGALSTYEKDLDASAWIAAYNAARYEQD